MTANYTNLVTLRGIHTVILNAWEDRDPVGRKFFNVFNSTQFREHSQTVGGIGLMETKSEGQAINYVAMVEGHNHTFTHIDYALGMRATREMMRDELYGIMDEMGVELATSAHATEETILANHLNNGFDSDFTGPDGIELFSSVHVREDGNTFRNELTSTADLSTTSLEQALIDFRDQRDGGGKRLQIKPKTLLVSPDNQWHASRILGSSHTPENDTNAVQPIKGILDLEVWDYLTDTDAWFILADKSDHKLVLYDREAFTSEHIYDFDTKDYKISGLFAQSSGWQDPRGIFGVQGV